MADACRTGAATDIIFGLALGYKSAIIPCIIIAITIYVSFSLASMYGIACAALGMLTTMATGARPALPSLRTHPGRAAREELAGAQQSAKQRGKELGGYGVGLGPYCRPAPRRAAWPAAHRAWLRTVVAAARWPRLPEAARGARCLPRLARKRRARRRAARRPGDRRVRPDLRQRRRHRGDGGHGRGHPRAHRRAGRCRQHHCRHWQGGPPRAPVAASDTKDATPDQECQMCEGPSLMSRGMLPITGISIWWQPC